MINLSNQINPLVGPLVRWSVKTVKSNIKN